MKMNRYKSNIYQKTQRNKTCDKNKMISINKEIWLNIIAYKENQITVNSNVYQ